MDVGALVAQHGYLALLVGSAVEGETFVVLAGFAAHRGYLSLPLVILAAGVLNFGWDQFYFWLGRRHGRWVLARFPSLRTKTAHVLELLERHHVPLIVGVRFLYGLRIAGPIAIGLGTVPWARFCALNFLGAMLWAAIFSVLGFLFGQALELLLEDLHRHEAWIFALIAATGLAAWLIFRRRITRPKVDN
jgi:membrane protein DedA with SNARE-associated domain